MVYERAAGGTTTLLEIDKDTFEQARTSIFMDNSQLNVLLDLVMNELGEHIDLVKIVRSSLDTMFVFHVEGMDKHNFVLDYFPDKKFRLTFGMSHWYGTRPLTYYSGKGTICKNDINEKFLSPIKKLIEEMKQKVQFVMSPVNVPFTPYYTKGN